MNVEVADTVFSKMRGLMFRTLGKGEGLLMKFSDVRKWKIWMLFVPKDLGLIFLNEDGIVVDKMVAERITLNPKTWNIYEPERKCKYIIECNPKVLDGIELDERIDLN